MPFLVAAVAIVVVIRLVIADGAAQIKDPVIHQAKVAVVARRDLKADKAVLNAVEIDLNDHRLLGLCPYPCPSLLLVVGFFSSAFLSVLLFSVLVLILVFVLLLADFVAARAERRFRILRERNEIDPLHVAIDFAEIGLAEDRVEIATRRRA